MSNFALNSFIRKGNPDKLTGILLAYARLASDADIESSPWSELVRGGVVSVSGNYREQHSLRDFLKKELQDQLGDDLEEGMRQFKERNNEQWQKLQELMSESERPGQMEIIPIPAKVVFFESEEDLLQSDADIFFLGEFKHVENAHLSVSAFPILYQSVFREQESSRLESEIMQMLNGAGMSLPIEESCLPAIDGIAYANFSGDLGDLLYRRLIPELIHRADREEEFNQGMQLFRNFMKGYPFQPDIDAIAKHIHDISLGHKGHQRYVELLCRKIAALRSERFEELRLIQSELQILDQEGQI